MSESPRKRRKESNQRTQGFLQSARLLDTCASGQKLLFLEHNWTVAHALKELGQRHIFSAPLVIKPDLEDAVYGAEDRPEPTFLGWIDVSTILQAFLKGLHQQHEHIPNKMLQLMPLLEAEGKAFAKKSLISIADAQDKALVFQADANTSLLDAIRDMFLKNYPAAGQGGVHRVAVFDAHGAITCIVSQLDILRFLLQNITELGYIVDESLDALGLLVDKSSVLLLDHDTPTLIAFQKMYEKGMSGAAVKAEGDHMIAHLSISDLRCIQAEHFGKLALPVAELLALTHDTAYAGYAASGPDSLENIQEEPFFGVATALSSSPPPGTSPRKSSSAHKTPGSPGRKPKKPSQAATAQLDRINTGIHDAVLHPITCTPMSTLKDVLELMVDNSVHRVYVVQEQQTATPQSSITPTDIMQMLVLLHT
ncbi:TPA: hypothetical protein ACH3X2_010120 [Trebouxia sp. C0005]